MSNNFEKLTKCYFDNLRQGLDCFQLIYYEHFGELKEEALSREKVIKDMGIGDIYKLISTKNPEFKILNGEIF
jgi:predicted GIY-YIG superfamily endonuclease